MTADDNKYSLPVLDSWNEDDGTMVSNVTEFTDAIIGRRIVEVIRDTKNNDSYWAETGTTFVLDDGTRVGLYNTSDCCAYTSLERVVEHLPTMDHIITGVQPDDDYNTWHILADFSEVLELDVSWSPGNPFYYAYGFYIKVEKPEDGE